MLSSESIDLLNDIQNLFYTTGFLCKFENGMLSLNEPTFELKAEFPEAFS